MSENLPFYEVYKHGRTKTTQVECMLQLNEYVRASKRHSALCAAI